MSDPPPPTTIVGTVNSLGDKLISVLPTQFLVLVLLNVGFLGLVLWFLSAEQDQKLAIIKQVIDHCK